MSFAEKVAILTTLGSSTVAGIYFLMKGKSQTLPSKDDVINKRKEILEDENVRMLYSTMSFLYLQGFEEENIQSFFKLYDILNISRPKFIALQLSQNQYDQKYLPILQNPKFPEIINKVDYLMKMKSEELKDIKDVNLKHLEKLYAIDFCNKNKCKIVLQDKDQVDYQRLLEAKQKLHKITIKDNPKINFDDENNQKQEDQEQQEKYQEEQKNHQIEIENIKQQIKQKMEEDFVDNLMKQLQPKFSIIPDIPYKTIVGIVEPNNIDGIAQLWKKKFKSTYGHQILEDEEVQNKKYQKQQQQSDQNNQETNQDNIYQQSTNIQQSLQNTSNQKLNENQK